MKNRTIITYLVLLTVILSFVLAGCGPAPGPGPGPEPPPPAPCSLQLISRDVWVYGTVYIDAQPQGWLEAFGSITIHNVPCGGTVNLYIIDAQGFQSNTRIVQLNQSGTTVRELLGWPWLFM